MSSIYDIARDGDIGSLSSKRIKPMDDSLNKGDDKENYTPLIWASKNGHSLVVEYLLANGAEVNKCGGWNNSTALIKAAEAGRFDVMKILICNGALVNIQNDFGSTALMISCESSQEVGAKLLIESNANVNLQNNYGYSALILASEIGITNIVLLLCENNANLEIANMFGKTALIMAAEMGHYEVVVALVNAEADINAQSKRGVTALMLASVKGHHKIVQYLIENNANVDIVNNDGDTAITMAVGCNQVEIVKYLVKKDLTGKCYFHKNKKGNNALMIAAEKGRLDLVKLFMNMKKTESSSSRIHSRRYRSLSGSLTSLKMMLFSSGSSDHEITSSVPEASVDLDDTNNEGFTAAILAAKNGQLIVLTFLIDKGADLTVETNGGETAISAIKNFYVKSPKVFETDYASLAGSHPKLLEMLPSILPYFSSPNIVLNNCFSSIMMGIKEQTNVVCGLVHVAVALKLCVANHPIEAKDLQERLELVESMLEECMQSDSMDADSNVLQVLHDTGSHSSSSSTVQYRNPIVSKAQAFMSGPLAQCIKYKLCSLLGTTQVSSLSDKVFWGYLRSSEVHGIRDISDLFQMRSDLVHIRTCPAAMFFMDGISKLCILFLVALISYQNSSSDSGLDGVEEYGVCREGRSSTEYFLIFMLLFTVLHEVGELHEVNWNLFDYFDEIWNYYDVAGDSLLLGWLFLSSSCRSTAIAAVMLKVAAVPISHSLLRYFVIRPSLGVLVLTIFGMTNDLGKFVVVYLTSIVGFGIAFHGLFPSIEAFSTIYKTIETLFDATIGKHDFSIFDGRPYSYVGVGMYCAFISLTMIILLNLVVAQMSATHGAINTTSFQKCSMMKAKNTQEFLLIQEKSPLSMLPAPLNVIPACLMPLHYLYIYWVTEGRAASEGSSKMSSKGSSKGGPESGSGTKKGKEVFSLSMSTSLPHVISICGTASDMTISLLLLLPHTLLEIYYALKHVKQQTSIRTYWTLLILAILFFPLTLCAYTWMLLKRIVEVRSYLKKSEETEVDGDGGYTSLKYEEYAKERQDQSTDESSASIELKLTCIRGNIIINLGAFTGEDFKFINYVKTKFIKFWIEKYHPGKFLNRLFSNSSSTIDEKDITLTAEEVEKWNSINEKLSAVSQEYLGSFRKDSFRTCVTIARKLFDLIRKVSMFGKSYIAVKFQIGRSVFKTKFAESSNQEPMWFQDMTLLLRDGDLKMNISVLDSSVEGGEQGREVGRAEIDIKSWIANGRFEGFVQLVDPEDLSLNVGTISIAVKSTSITKTNAEKAHYLLKQAVSRRHQRSMSMKIIEQLKLGAAAKVYFNAQDKERIFYGLHEGSLRGSSSKALTGYELVTETRRLLNSQATQLLKVQNISQDEILNNFKIELEDYMEIKLFELRTSGLSSGQSPPLDGVYYRAEGVSADLRSFPKTGPENIRKCLFKIPDAETKEVPSRLVVPEGKRYWTTPWTDYTVSYYITEEVLSNCRNRNPKGWADPEPGIAEDDETHRKLFKPYNPIWLTGIVRDAEGRLLHPYGRTGITGQGVLGNRHVNEAVDPIVLYFDVSCQVLKVLLVKRNPLDMHDNSWAIPGGMVDYIADSDCYSVPQRLGKLLTKFDVTLPKMLGDVYQDVFRELKEETGFDGKVVYQKLLAQMYSDDVRNTDSTWIVTSVFLLIAEDCVAIRADGRENSDATWFPFQEAMRLNFFASHFSMLKAAAKYYVSRSFADRKLQGTEEHRYAYEYLAKIPALNITSSFEKMIGNSDN